jgi:hypothetical protein
MPTPEENKLLFAMGDRIEEIVLGGRTSFGARNAMFLARSTWNELRELYYYVHDPRNHARRIADIARLRTPRALLGVPDEP